MTKITSGSIKSVCVVGCSFLILSNNKLTAIKMPLSCITETKLTRVAFIIHEKEHMHLKRVYAWLNESIYLQQSSVLAKFTSSHWSEGKHLEIYYSFSVTVTEQLQISSAYDRLFFIHKNLFVRGLSGLCLPEKYMVTMGFKNSLWALKHSPYL